MEEKDLFWITDDKGNELQMEAVVMYSIKLTGFNYIIYRDLEQLNYYVAKFTDDDVKTQTHQGICPRSRICHGICPKPD